MFLFETVINVLVGAFVSTKLPYLVTTSSNTNYSHSIDERVRLGNSPAFSSSHFSLSSQKDSPYSLSRLPRAQTAPVKHHTNNSYTAMKHSQL